MSRITSRNESQQGIALLGAMILVLILSLLGATLLNLAGQEAISAGAVREVAVAQQLADAAGELVVAGFHSPETVPPALSSALAKRSRTAAGAPSFFDSTGRSQFIGTADRPDLLLDARNLSDDRMMNDPEVGVFRAMRGLGRIQEIKVYAPSRPGLLCTVDVTVATQFGSSVRQSAMMQLGTLDVPPLLAAVQVGQSLGMLQPGKESPVGVHWGDLKVGEDLILRRTDEIPTRSILAPVTGQGYDETAQRDDRWVEAWMGGQVQETQPPPGTNSTPPLPANVHVRQNPVPGIRLDQWTYEQLKRVAKLYGSYFAIDRNGLLYPQGTAESGRGVSPDEVFQSEGVGDQRGLIFIDTLDQAAPRADNLGTVTIRAAYLEGIVVIQGHVVLAPNGSGRSLSVFSPPSIERDGMASRLPVQLSRVNLNGVLYVSGNITVTERARIFGAVAAGGTITSGSTSGTLEVWYNHDLGQGLYKGVPVVYRAPGTWLVRY